MPESGQVLQEIRSYLEKQSTANERMVALLQQEMPSIKLALAQLQADANRWRGTLDGNGQESLGTRVALLTTGLKELKRTIEQQADRRWQVWLAMIGALFSVVIVLVEVVLR